MRWLKKINDCCSQLIRWSCDKFKKRGKQIEVLLGQLGELQKNWGINSEEIREKARVVDGLWAQDVSFW